MVLLLRIATYKLTSLIYPRPPVANTIIQYHLIGRRCSPWLLKRTSDQHFVTMLRVHEEPAQFCALQQSKSNWSLVCCNQTITLKLFEIWREGRHTVKRDFFEMSLMARKGHCHLVAGAWEEFSGNLKFSGFMIPLSLHYPYKLVMIFSSYKMKSSVANLRYENLNTSICNFGKSLQAKGGATIPLIPSSVNVLNRQ